MSCKIDEQKKELEDLIIRYQLWKKTDLYEDIPFNDNFFIYNKINWLCWEIYGHMNESSTDEFDQAMKVIERVQDNKTIGYLWK
jgi:hypothetical protein